MGCFSVVCNLTKTPIQCGDKVHIVFFNEGFNGLGDDICWILRDFHSYFTGTYNDYGSIEEGEDSQISKLMGSNPMYYFCDEAWKFLDKVVKKEQESVDSVCEALCSGKSALFVLEYMQENPGCSRQQAKEAFKKGKFLPDQPIIKKLCAAWLFAMMNGIHIFQNGFFETYYGQQIHYKEMNEFNKLRQKIVDKITKEEKKKLGEIAS